MHKAILAAVAAAAVFAPAIAQQIHIHEQPQSGQESQAQPQTVPAAPSQAAASPELSPQLLNSSQIREIQQALEAHGNATRIDGAWGPDMETAITNFQKSENLISQNGKLDPLTLTALGLNPLMFGLGATPSETTGQAIRDSAPPQESPEQEAPPHQPIHDQPTREGDEER